MKKQGNPRNFTVTEAARLAKLSLTMTDYLCRTEIIVPSGSNQRGRGCRRQYTFGDVVMLRAVAKLLHNGIEVAKLKSSLLRLRKHHPQITTNTLPAALLVTDGERVYFRESNEALLDLSKGQLTFAFVLELSSIQKEVKARLGEQSTQRRRA